MKPQKLEQPCRLRFWPEHGYNYQWGAMQERVSGRQDVCTGLQAPSTRRQLLRYRTAMYRS